MIRPLIALLFVSLRRLRRQANKAIGSEVVILLASGIIFKAMMRELDRQDQIATSIAIQKAEFEKLRKRYPPEVSGVGIELIMFWISSSQPDISSAVQSARRLVSSDSSSTVPVNVAPYLDQAVKDLVVDQYARKLVNRYGMDPDEATTLVLKGFDWVVLEHYHYYPTKPDSQLATQ